MTPDIVVDYSGQTAGTYFSHLEVLQGRGRMLRGLKWLDRPINGYPAVLYDALLSVRCEREDDQAFVCIYGDEEILITKEQYEIFRAEGLFTDSLWVCP